MEISALHKRGMSISDIARHRRTVRNYINGTTTPGVRRKSTTDPFEDFVDYIRYRFTEDPHLCGRSVRRTVGFGFCTVLSDDDPQDPAAETATGLPGLQDRNRPSQRHHRPPTG
jgi:hypothetical protein